MANQPLPFTNLSLVLQALNQRSQHQSCWKLTYQPTGQGPNGQPHPSDSLMLCYENLVDFPFEEVRLQSLRWRVGNTTIKILFRTATVDIYTPNHDLYLELYPLLRNAGFRRIYLVLQM